MKLLQISRAFRGVVFVAVTVLLAGAVHGQSQATSSIHGTAVDSDGAAIPGVRVTVTCDCKECPTRPCTECCPSGFVATATTDDEGRFRIEKIPPGVYLVSGETKGFGKAEAHGVQVTADSASTLTLTFKRETAAAASEATKSAANTSEETARLQVQIINRQTEKPLENAKVTLLFQCECKKECPTKPCAECCPAERQMFTTITDASGLVTFDGPPGTYRIDTAYRAYSKDSLVTLAAGDMEKLKVKLTVKENR